DRGERHLDEARGLFQQVDLLDPNNAEVRAGLDETSGARVRLAAAREGAGKRLRAREHLRAAQPDLVRAQERRRLGELEEADARLSQALLALFPAVGLWPESAEVKVTFTRASLAQGELALARDQVAVAQEKLTWARQYAEDP